MTTTKEPFRVPTSLFDLGKVFATRGVLDTVPYARLPECLDRHKRGDWGVVCPEDRESNFDALFSGARILSAYPIDPAKPCEGWGKNTLWIITEADRSLTTFLLPDEY